MSIKIPIKSKPKIVFEYEDSFLSIFQIKDAEFKDLIDQCIEDLYENDDYLEFEPEIKVRGRLCHQKRNIAFISDNSEGYKYSGQIAKSKPTTEAFRKLLDKVNKIYKAEYNGILVNEYTDGTKNIGRHADSEKDLDPNAGVICLSMGTSRKLKFRRKGYDYDEDGKEHLPPVLYEHETGDYELLQMGGKFQSQLTHEISPQLKIKEKRISFTFRVHTS